MKRLCNWLLYRVMGWQKNITVPLPRKYIICLAPHTSNWDFLIGQLYSRAEGTRINFLMKKEWFFWPLGPIFRRMGGIPVFRSKNTSLTDNLAEEARKADTFVLCITPEGTRKATDYWKRGFLLHRPESSDPGTALRTRLRHKNHHVHKRIHTIGRHRKRNAGDKGIFQRLQR